MPQNRKYIALTNQIAVFQIAVVGLCIVVLLYREWKDSKYWLLSLIKAMLARARKTAKREEDEKVT